MTREEVRAKLDSDRRQTNIHMFNGAVVTDGIPRWKINDHIPPDDVLADWRDAGLPFDYKKSIAQSEIETEESLRHYRMYRMNNGYSEEEKAEMRLELGDTAVDVITGKRIDL